jgi:hypothetical protein
MRPTVTHLFLARWSRFGQGSTTLPPKLVLPSVAQVMPESRESDMHGFEPPEAEVQTPPVRVEEVTRDTLIRIVASLIVGATPEEIVGYLDDEFPPDVADMIARPLELDELNAHVDILLGALQMPTEGLTRVA